MRVTTVRSAPRASVARRLVAVVAVVAAALGAVAGGAVAVAAPARPVGADRPAAPAKAAPVRLLVAQSPSFNQPVNAAVLTDGSGKVLQHIALPTGPNELRLSPNGQLMTSLVGPRKPGGAFVSTNGIAIRNLATGVVHKVTPAGCTLSNVAWAPDSLHVAFVDRCKGKPDRFASLDVRQRVVHLLGKVPAGGNRIVVAPGGKLAAQSAFGTGDQAGTTYVRIITTKTGAVTATWKTDVDFESSLEMAFTPDTFAVLLSHATVSGGGIPDCAVIDRLDRKTGVERRVGACSQIGQGTTYSLDSPTASLDGRFVFAVAGHLGSTEPFLVRLPTGGGRATILPTKHARAVSAGR